MGIWLLPCFRIQCVSSYWVYLLCMLPWQTLACRMLRTSFAAAAACTAGYRYQVVWRRPAPTKVRCRSIASTTTAALVAVYCPCAFARSCHTGGNTKLAVKETPYAASRTPQIVWLRCGTTVPAGQRRVDCSRVAPSQRCDVRASAGLQ